MLNGNLIRGMSLEDEERIIYGTSEIGIMPLKDSIRKTLLDIMSDNCDVTSYEDVLRLAVTLNKMSEMLVYGLKLGVFEERGKEVKETVKVILRFNSVLIERLKSMKK